MTGGQLVDWMKANAVDLGVRLTPWQEYVVRSLPSRPWATLAGRRGGYVPLRPGSTYRLEWRPGRQRGRHLHVSIPQHQLSQPLPLPIDGFTYRRRTSSRRAK